MFENVSFSVLGLGDTNYDKFCHMGKCIDKRLGELGGKRLLDLVCADEAVGLEEVVERWKRSVIDIMKTTYIYSTVLSTSQEKKDCFGDVSAIPQEEGCHLPEPSMISTGIKQYESFVQMSPPVGVKNAYEIMEWLNIVDKLELQPPSSSLPRSKQISSTFTLIDSAIPDKLENQNLFQSEYTCENPLDSQVLSAEYLTSSDPGIHEWGEDKSVIRLELSLNNSGINYQPGDSIGICCPNPTYLVDIVFNRVALSEDSFITYDSVVQDSTSNEFYTLRELLYHKFDLSGQPKKASVATLSKFCSNVKESNFLQWLCSKGDVGKCLWQHFVEDQQIGIAELLHLVPSCIPPMNVLLSCLSPLPPRFYSIASSQLSHPCSVVIVFSVVHYVSQIKSKSSYSTPALKRYGVCTSFLEELLQPWLSTHLKASQNRSATIRIFHKSTPNFHLPGSLAHPLILIGPGTGVAPFIGFLEHREICGHERAKSGDDTSTGVWRGEFELENLPCESGYVGRYIQSVANGSIHLFFGCRGPRDFLFKDFLQNKFEAGILTCLDVAMSRVGPEKVYVTNKLHDRAAEIFDLIMNQGAYIYVCGDGNAMAKSVAATLTQILSIFGNISMDEANSILEDLRHRRRYLQDIWS